MRREARQQAFEEELPWLKKRLRRIPGGYEYHKDVVAAATFELKLDGFTKGQILLLDEEGNTLAEVRGVRRFLWIGLPFGLDPFYRPPENVSSALGRLEEKAKNVKFILTVATAMDGKTYATVWYARGKTNIAELCRKLAAKEETRVRLCLQHALA